MWNDDNVFLNGPYEPWRQEGVAFDLEIDGTLPDGLNGALFRAGTSQHFRPRDPARYHWFDGDGMVHGIYFRDGRVTYRNRYVATASLKLEMKEGRALYGSFMNGGTPPDLTADPPMKNPANTNVTLYDDRLLVFCEADVPHELRPDTLETTNQHYNFHGTVAGPVSAHPKVDPDDGAMLFFTNVEGNVTWYRADPTGVVSAIHRIDLGVPTFTHDYVVTEDYAVFLVNPSMVRMSNALKGLPSTVWEPETLPSSKWAVLNHRTGDVHWIDGDGPFAQTHFLNAYQDGSRIVIDGHRTDKFGATWKEIEDPSREPNKWFTDVRAAPWRWELDLATGRMSQWQVSDILGEFPRINDAHAGRAHRYGYFTTTRDTGPWFTDGLAKHDYQTGRTEVQELDGVLSAPSELVFVARENATIEDDGWVVSIWYDPQRDRSEVVVQEAQNFEAVPTARIKLNHRVPLGFHGNWAPASDLDKAIATW